MAEVASSVLHNVGNVLNSVNVSAGLVTEQLQKLPREHLTKAVAMLRQNSDNLAEFLSQDDRGRKIPSYLETVAKFLDSQITAAVSEMQNLAHNIEHIKRVVNAQQDSATCSAVLEELDLCAIVEDALNLSVFPTEVDTFRIVRDFETPAVITTDRHVVLQILVNLIRNAKHALQAGPPETRIITLRVRRQERDSSQRIAIQVTDTGHGIPAENLTKIFNHGFTTKKRGHGFGLHASSNAAQQLGGSLAVQSPGVGCGATFTLELPLRLAQIGV
jgi:signal transduction histidine kinase